MSIETRRIIVSFNEDGTPIYKQLKAFSQDEMNVKIVKAFIESGRIHEILSTCHFSPSGKTIRLKDYCQEWISRKRRIKESTRATYQKRLNEYIIPFLGNLTFDEIKVSDVQRLLDKHSNLSNKTLGEIRSTLSQVFKYALSDDLIKKNPCESVDIVIPSTKKSERKALSLNNYQDIISNLINGIGSMISSLVNKVKDIAGTIKSYLGFSEPEKGPLSDFHTYMPDMIDLMREGIEGNISKLKEPMTDLASALIPGQKGTIEQSAIYTKANGNSGTDISSLTEAVLKYLPKMANQQIVLDSGALVGELAGGMNRQLGKAYL